MFKKILFAAKSDVYEVAKVIQGTDFCRSSGHHANGGGLIHIAEAILCSEDLMVAGTPRVGVDQTVRSIVPVW